MHILLFVFLFLLPAPAFAASSCPPVQERIGPAEIHRECNAKTGQVTAEEWRVDDKLSRANGPARITVDRNKNGITVTQEWWLNGEPHPNPGPSLVHYNPATETVDREEWRIKGKLHRDNGPALIEYNPETGEALKQEWYLNGKKQKAPPAR